MIRGWLYYGTTQVVQVVASVAGLVVLLLPCRLRAWQPSPHPSINDGRPIDEWSWPLLNRVYGNPEDGVSGEHALVWVNGTTRVPFDPTLSPWRRAYAWSALRNSADQLKYTFQWRGPGVPRAAGTFRLFRWTFSYTFGYKVENTKYLVPVFGIKPVA